MRPTKSLRVAKVVSATCASEKPSWMFCCARFQPSVCACSLVARDAPAASADAWVMRNPVESRSADTANRLCAALMKRDASSDSAVTSKRIVMRRQLEATQWLPDLCYEVATLRVHLDYRCRRC